VAIIGGGVSGIITALKLTQAGFRDVTVFERSAGPGGTWWDNTYPGCEVDIKSHAYSYSCMRYDWSRNFARQPEVKQYLQDVVDRFGIRSAFRFGTVVKSVDWQEDEQRHHVTLDTGEVLAYDVVVSAVGLLSNPNVPAWAEGHDFEGEVFHTSRWGNDRDLRGKRVAVVGTGSSGVQVIPELATVAGQVFHFQRSPTWIVPKGERDFTQRERKLFSRVTALQWISRLRTFRSIEGRKYRKGVREVESAQQVEWRDACVSFIEQEIDDPKVRELVTPDYPVGCKRLVFASTYYGALNRENVELVPQGVTRMTRTGIVDAEGVEREVDAVVLATGFTPQKFLTSLEVRGREGRSIHDIWGDSAKALLGMSVPEVPNFFMLYGPNTNGGVSTMAQSERQAESLVRTLKRMVRSGATAVDTRQSVLDRYIGWVDRQNAKRTSSSPDICSNYYFDATGRNVTQWPSTHKVYRAALTVLPPIGLKMSRGEGALTGQRSATVTPAPGVAPPAVPAVPVSATLEQPLAEASAAS
jgi:cation diffusion facilitator CzcD-associated flavoprotein CzcO